MGRAAHRLPAGSPVPSIIRPRAQQGLGTDEAAHFIGVSSTFFRTLVEQGKMPKPRVLGSRKLWDVDELAASFKALPIEGEGAGGSWADFEEEHGL